MCVHVRVYGYVCAYVCVKDGERKKKEKSTPSQPRSQEPAYLHFPAANTGVSGRRFCFARGTRRRPHVEGNEEARRRTKGGAPILSERSVRRAERRASNARRLGDIVVSRINKLEAIHEAIDKCRSFQCNLTNELTNLESETYSSAMDYNTFVRFVR